jgi:DNA-binding winged helix-turn-helix (wHTH) protein
VLDIERRELRRGAEPVAVEPQVFDLLVYLVENRGRVVSKDDLIQGVWGGRIVSDSALTTRLNAARKAVNDSGAAQRVIRTMHRKGMRFIGEVSEDPEPAVPSEAARAATEPPTAPRRAYRSSCCPLPI